jgi:hypothetical protein
MQLSKRSQSASAVLPAYRCLLYTLSDSEACISQPIKDLKLKLHSGLRQSMRNYESKKYLRISTLLDPRFKNHPNIFSAAERIQNEAYLKAEILIHEYDSNSEQPTHKRAAISKYNKKTVSDDIFENFLVPHCTDRPSSSKTQTTQILEEIEAFFKVTT